MELGGKRESLKQARDARKLTSGQIQKHGKSRERFGLKISNDAVKGKSKPEWGPEDRQMAKIQTHAIFEKYLRIAIKQRGIQMPEDDLQKVISVNIFRLRTINSSIEPLAGDSPKFRVDSTFDESKSKIIHGSEARDFKERYPMDKLQEAAHEAMEKTTEEIKRSENGGIDDL